MPDKLREATRFCSFYLLAIDVNCDLEEHLEYGRRRKGDSITLVGAMMGASVIRLRRLQSGAPIVVVRKNQISGIMRPPSPANTRGTNR
jgi:hypothetical protein